MEPPSRQFVMKPILKMVNAHSLVKEAVIASGKTCAVLHRFLPKKTVVSDADLS